MYYDRNTKKFSENDIEVSLRKPIRTAVDAYHAVFGGYAKEPEDPKLRDLRDAIERLASAERNQ